MVLRMKNFIQYFGGSLKDANFLAGGVGGGGRSRRTNVEGEGCLKKGLGQFADLRGAW